jgi:uncharacterized iron-regulated protein
MMALSLPLVGWAQTVPTVQPKMPAGHGQSAITYTPQRVYDAKKNRYSDFEAMLLDLASHDVVFVGEQHDDPATHRLERAILEGLARRRSGILVSLEMFERDTQPALDDYLAGRLSEAEFLKVSRPWPRYHTDYRPLVEFARAHNWPVLGGNIPRKYAARVSREGLASIEKLPPAERQFAAATFQCPFDDYFDNFAEVMSSHPVGGSESAPQKDGKEEKKGKVKLDPRLREMTERFYFAQCAKDETMAESIASRLQAADARQPPLVVHFNGAFHSDYRLGTAARVKNRLPKSRAKVVSIVPLASLDQIDHDKFKKRGDYIVFTLGKS